MAAKADRDEAILRVIADAMSRRTRGEVLPDSAIISAHADLLPELEERLAALHRIHRSYLAAQAAGAANETAEPSAELSEAQPLDPAHKPRPVHGGIAIHGYTLIGEISSGGQGTVFKAIQDSTGRTVAIKILPGGSWSGSRQRARFEREAEILARLDHPAIVGITDRGRTADGSLFIVMNYIDGWCLDEYVGRCMMEAPDDKGRLLRLFIEIAQAVDAAHRQGVVHRDLKPSNIRVDREGRPHVLDFGLARLTVDDESTRAVTETGQIVGSLPWASPEQVSGSAEALDGRSDVYSLGVMLYHALTGSFPYCVRGSLREVIDGILNYEPVPPSQNRDLHSQVTDPVLDAIVLKALSKSPLHRYASASELAQDLKRYLAGDHTLASRHRATRKRSRRHLLLLGGILVLAIAGLGTYWRTRPPTVPVEPLKRFKNSIGMEFVRIPAGMFQMGSPKTEPGRDREERQKTCRMQPFWMSVTEVTQGQYVAVMGKLPAQQIWVGDDIPVCGVFWEEAVAFCEKLSKREKREYRLPTEGQWEYACRAGTDGQFGGTQYLEEMGWYSGNSRGQLRPVASKCPNHWGLYDMHGGVREWCADVYAPSSYTGEANPLGPKRRDWKWLAYVLRGGSFKSDEAACRSARRDVGYEKQYLGSVRFADTGFRVVTDDR